MRAGWIALIVVAVAGCSAPVAGPDTGGKTSANLGAATEGNFTVHSGFAGRRQLDWKCTSPTGCNYEIKSALTAEAAQQIGQWATAGGLPVSSVDGPYPDGSAWAIDTAVITIMDDDTGNNGGSLIAAGQALCTLSSSQGTYTCAPNPDYYPISGGMDAGTNVSIFLDYVVGLEDSGTPDPYITQGSFKQSLVGSGFPDPTEIYVDLTWTPAGG